MERWKEGGPTTPQQTGSEVQEKMGPDQMRTVGLTNTKTKKSHCEDPKSILTSSRWARPRLGGLLIRSYTSEEGGGKRKKVK